MLISVLMSIAGQMCVCVCNPIDSSLIVLMKLVALTLFCFCQKWTAWWWVWNMFIVPGIKMDFQRSITPSMAGS